MNCSSVTVNIFLHCFVVSQKNDTLRSNMKKTKMEILKLKGEYNILNIFVTKSTDRT